MKIYVGNLAHAATEEAVEAYFAEFGSVQDVKIIKDKFTGNPRGFAFITIEDEAGKAAIDALDGKEFQGRTLRVNEARPREERPNRPSGNRGGFGGYNRDNSGSRGGFGGGRY